MPLKILRKTKKVDAGISWWTSDLASLRNKSTSSYKRYKSAKNRGDDEDTLNFLYTVFKKIEPFIRERSMMLRNEPGREFVVIPLRSTALF